MAVCEFDENKNIIEHRLNNETFHYDYDQQNRLLLKKNLFQDKFTQVDETDCLYDLQENLIHKEGYEYVYDKNNRLVQVIGEFLNKLKQRNNAMNTLLYSSEIPIAIFKDGILEQLKYPQ